jgi:hypothetical protein
MARAVGCVAEARAIQRVSDMHTTSAGAKHLVLASITFGSSSSVEWSRPQSWPEPTVLRSPGSGDLPRCPLGERLPPEPSRPRAIRRCPLG